MTTWTELKRLLTNKYCPRTEIKKMEDEFYGLIVKGNDLKTYIKRFQELAILCPNMVPNSEKLMEAFIGGLPQSIEGNVNAASSSFAVEVNLGIYILAIEQFWAAAKVIQLIPLLIPIIDQPSSSSQPKKDKPSKKAQRQEAEVPQDEAEHEESVPTPSNDP
ncbi:reverse transcriptase domain-containing protein [Tanacetum coccineum]